MKKYLCHSIWGKKMQKVRIEDYKCGMTTVLSGVKENVLKKLGRKCTQMLTLIILCWQNYGQFLSLNTIFIFYTFYHSYYIYKKEKNSLEKGGKKDISYGYPIHTTLPLLQK